MCFVYNFVQVFGYNPFLWWLPVIVDTPYFGLYFPQRPTMLKHQNDAVVKAFYD